MFAPGPRSGLTPRFAAPPPALPDRVEPDPDITEEAGIVAGLGPAPRVELLAEEDAHVARGAPVARLRDAPEICLVAPMAARIGRVSLLRGHRLSEIVLFADAGGDALRHDLSGARTEAGLRGLMQRAGLWPSLRRRPFGGIPGTAERPAAIFVMATDTRPFAPDPRLALDGREAAVARGLHALAELTDGPVFLCRAPGPGPFTAQAAAPRLREVICGRRHPQGAVGLRAHALCPAGLDRPVWDIHAEDAAALGTLLDTGQMPPTRLVAVCGPALRTARLVRTQPGADLRGLTRRIAQPGAHELLSGTPLDGHPAHWLSPRDRQVTALPRAAAPGAPHWLLAALTRSARPAPVIPTAALEQSFGGALPAAAFVRALGAGDDEGAMRLGLLSLLEEDVALADYVLGGTAGLAGQLRAMLERIRTEHAA
jgi:Na+-transporting NADH:ubiquinone oxidoreductase subunit A